MFQVMCLGRVTIVTRVWQEAMSEGRNSMKQHESKQHKRILGAEFSPQSLKSMSVSCLLLQKRRASCLRVFPREELHR